MATWRSVLIAAAFLTSGSSIGNAAQLLLVEQPGCPPCKRFDSEVLPSYGQTAGKEVPLRRISVFRSWPDDLSKVGQTRFTPVFILVDQGKEIGRFHGYLGAKNFWFNLERLLAKMYS